MTILPLGVPKFTKKQPNVIVLVFRTLQTPMEQNHCNWLYTYLLKLQSLFIKDQLHREILRVAPSKIFEKKNRKNKKYWGIPKNKKGDKFSFLKSLGIILKVFVSPTLSSISSFWGVTIKTHKMCYSMFCQIVTFLNQAPFLYL